MRESFVYHAEYIADIPTEYRAQWGLYAIDYGINGIIPELNDWRDIRDWKRIQKRIDQDIESWEKEKERRSSAGKAGAEKRWNKNSNAIAEHSEPKLAMGNIADNVYVNDNVSESVYVNDVMYVSDDESNNVDNSTENVEKSDIASHCTTSTVQNIKNTTLLYGFTLTPKQTESFLEKTDSFNGDLPSLVNFIIKKTMAQYEGKPAEELKKLFVNALTKYPESYLDEFHENSKYEKKKAEKDSFMLIYLNPPSRKCTCGTEFEERPDIDEFTNINYTAFKCPSCSTMLTCEKGKWLYSPGASDMAIAAV